MPQPQAAGAPASRSRHGGALDPRAVPCSLLGVKKVRSAATMGPASGEELVSPSKWLRAHEREPQLPQRESRRLLGAAAGNRRRCCSTTAGARRRCRPETRPPCWDCPAAKILCTQTCKRRLRRRQSIRSRRR